MSCLKKGRTVRLISGVVCTLSLLFYVQAHAETWEASASASVVNVGDTFTVTVSVVPETGDFDGTPQTTFGFNSSFFEVASTETLSAGSTCVPPGNIIFGPDDPSPPVGVPIEVCRYTVAALAATTGPEPVVINTNPTWTSIPAVQVDPPTFPISVAANPASGGSASCDPNPVAQGGSSTCTATPNPGFAFTGWSGDCSGPTCVLTNVQSAQSVTANFEAVSYPITVAANPANGGSASCDPNPVAQGGSSTCTATANSGFTFTGWSGDCSGSTCVLSDVQSAQSVTANFEADSYPITVAVNPADGGSASCTPNPVEPGGSSTCTATANPGFTFSGWSGDCSGPTCTLTNVQGPQSVTANFTGAQYSITASSSPSSGGSTVCTPAQVSFNGTSVCTAAPASGFVFERWNGDCAFAGTATECVLENIVADRTVVAIYAQDGPDLSEEGVTGTVTEGLRGNQDPVAREAIRPLAENCSTATDQNVLDQCAAIIELAESDRPEALVQVLKAISGEELSAQVTSSIDAANQRGAQIDARIAALRGGATGISLDDIAFNYRDRQVPLGMMFNALAASNSAAQGSDEGFGGGLLDQRLGAFLNVTVVGGKRDSGAFEVGFDFDGYSALAGLDWRFSDRFIAGAALGWSDLSSDLNDDGGGLDSTGWSLTGYGTWLISERAYLDFSVGRLWNDYDQERVVDLSLLGGGFSRAVAVGRTDAEQTSFGVGGGWDIAVGSWVYSPRGSLLWTESKIDGFTESGAGVNDLIFDDQSFDSLLWTFSQSLSHSFSTSSGALQPYATLDLSRETRNKAFSISPTLRVRPDQRSTPIFIDESDRFFGRGEVGMSFIGARGFQWFAAYSRILGYDKVSAWAFRGGLRWEF